MVKRRGYVLPGEEAEGLVPLSMLSKKQRKELEQAAKEYAKRTGMPNVRVFGLVQYYNQFTNQWATRPLFRINGPGRFKCPKFHPECMGEVISPIELGNRKRCLKDEVKNCLKDSLIGGVQDICKKGGNPLDHIDEIWDSLPEVYTKYLEDSLTNRLKRVLKDRLEDILKDGYNLKKVDEAIRGNGVSEIIDDICKPVFSNIDRIKSIERLDNVDDPDWVIENYLDSNGQIVAYSYYGSVILESTYKPKRTEIDVQSTDYVNLVTNPNEIERIKSDLRYTFNGHPETYGATEFPAIDKIVATRCYRLNEQNDFLTVAVDEKGNPIVIFDDTRVDEDGYYGRIELTAYGKSSAQSLKSYPIRLPAKIIKHKKGSVAAHQNQFKRGDNGPKTI